MKHAAWIFPDQLKALAGTNAADSPGLQARVDPQTFGTEERLPQQHEATPPQAVKQFYKNLILKIVSKTARDRIALDSRLATVSGPAGGRLKRI